MKNDYIKLLEILDENFADYGNSDLKFPDEELEEKFRDDFDSLTQEEALEIIEWNTSLEDAMAMAEEYEEDEGEEE